MMIEIDPGTLSGVMTIAASVGAGLLGRKAIGELDRRRDARLAAREQQRPAPRPRVAAGARR